MLNVMRIIYATAGDDNSYDNAIAELAKYEEPTEIYDTASRLLSKLSSFSDEDIIQVETILEVLVKGICVSSYLEVREKVELISNIRAQLPEESTVNRQVKCAIIDSLALIEGELSNLHGEVWTMLQSFQDGTEHDEYVRAYATEADMSSVITEDED